jgi:hypothetical protein
MGRALSDIAFTPRVRAAQERHGSREGYASLDTSEDARSTIGPREAEFIAARDSFYMATVGETGWPYVQHRGGAPGFLRVLDERTLAFADFRGNRQYLSVGNLEGEARVSLILVDYAHRRRLKVWGEARTVAVADDPALIERVEVADYRANVERAIVIRVRAFDWNCPQHITRRFTEAEVERALAALRAENAALREELSARGAAAADRDP